MENTNRSKITFEKLIRDFCALFKLENAEHALHGNWVMINNVAFSFSYGKVYPEPVISMYANFGPIPPKKENEIQRVLLETNFFLHLKQGPTFSISAKEKQVICAFSCPSETLSAKKLCEMVVNLSSIAHEWRKTYFLNIKADQIQANSAARFAAFRNINFKSELPRE